MQGTQNKQNNPEKQKQRRLMLPNFKTFYKSTFIKALWNCNKDRYIDQWEKIVSTIILYIYGQLHFDKGAKITQWGKKIFLQLTMLKTTRYPYAKEKCCDHSSQHIKNYLKMDQRSKCKS